MGFAKNQWMEWEERGMSPGEEGNVCGNCLGDHVLSQFVANNATESSCDYCDRTENTPFAIPLFDVAEVMADVIAEEWTDPANELPYDGREGGYQGNVIDACDLLEEIGFEPESDQLLDDLATYFNGHDWCRKDAFAATPSERLRFGWQRFCRVVMHHRRYTFWTDLADDQSENHPDYLPPGGMLTELHDVMRELALIQEFPLGTRYWRAADHLATESLSVPTRFTSPPEEFATQPNRMSPAGIPMFYGTDDFDTAVIEVCGTEVASGRAASAVQFECCRPLHLLDLAQLHHRVSYFAPNGRDAWHRAAFFRYFARDISEPILRDKQQHIAYVPTQVLTEYVRYHMQAESGASIDGIRYLSSRNRRPCVVLFFDQDDCLQSRDGRPQSLVYVPDSLRTERLDMPRT